MPDTPSIGRRRAPTPSPPNRPPNPHSLSIGALALDPADADVLYCGTGEANLSADSYASDGLATKPFYDLAVAQGNGQVIAGGAQDNGTLITRDGQPNGWQEWTGGDGGWVAIDPTDVDHIYSTAQGMIVWRHRAGDGFRRVDPPETKAVKEMIWMAATAMDARTPTTVYIGSVRVWKSVDDGESWRPVSDALDGSAISALEVARNDSNRLYAGTENGGLFRSRAHRPPMSGTHPDPLAPADP